MTCPRAAPAVQVTSQQWLLSSFGFWKTQLNGLTGRCLHKYECVKIWASHFCRSTLLLLSFEFFISLFPHPICSCWSCFRPDIVNYFNTAICFAHSAHDPHQSHRKWNEEVDPGKGLWWAAYCVTGLWTSRAAALIGIILLFTKETTIFYMKSIFPVLIMLASYRKWEFASDTLCWVSCKLSWDLRWSQEITWGNIQGSFLVKCWLCERDLWWKLRPGEDSEGRENGESQVERERRGN